MKKNSRGTSPHRTRHLMIYTFLLILVLLYFASRQQRLTMEGQQKVEDAKKQVSVLELKKTKEKPSPDSGDALVLEQEEMWSLILTNESHPVPENINIQLKKIDGTEESVDERVYGPLMKMLAEMRQQGMDPIVCSGYRTKEKQTELYQQQIQEFIDQGHPEKEAEELAKKEVSVPQSGEHRLGLAVDIYSGGHLALDVGFADTPEGIWLREHASDYGFILRYEQGKENQTGINYEPWHFRYVGVKAAQYMKEHGLCLEEFYLDQGLYG
ncbi:M15 family metallopeptidase [Faecalicatena sp. AGMB00832]|uniref:M15 family metallopeptidase n=1 Tax=Faecalicatena faecalis TaxID=2726362 RepID=A0ABS6D980_9FIRM|nr:M15 family metallopeptidase [Faecalicatena faecalis]MBU3878164.1 M15 family metallopeptidase [Faecalicatena faecalis]